MGATSKPASRGGRHGPAYGGGGQQPGRVHAGGRPGRARVRREGLGDPRGAVGVDPARGADHLVDPALAEQGEQRPLGRPGRHVVGVLAVLDESREQGRRRHHPADPQAGPDRLGGGAEVGDAGPVEGGESGDRRDVVPELGVVVVLHDERVVLARRGEERQPVGGRHDVAERVLVRRRDVGGRQPADRDRRGRRAGRRPRGRRRGPPRPPPGSRGRPRRSGRLAGGGAAAGARRSCPRQQHLVGVDGQPAGPGQPLGDRDPELGDAARVGIARRRRRGRHLAPRAPPAGGVPRVDPGRAEVEADQVLRGGPLRPRPGRRLGSAAGRHERARPPAGR